MLFYVDASLPLPVAKALALVRDDVLYPGSPGCPITTPAMHDKDWLRIAGHNNWVVLIRDKHVRSRPGERAAVWEHGVRAFFLTGAGNYTRWQVLDLLVRSWPAIEQTAASDSAPFAYSVTQGGLRKLLLGNNR